MRLDLHVHSIYSKNSLFGRDAFNTPRELIKIAIKRGLDGIAITDHQTLKGGLVGIKEARRIKKDFLVICGMEISTSCGELLALDIKEKISDNLSIEESVELIRDLGGITIAPHPFSVLFRKCLCEKAIHADAIEVFNSFSFDYFNAKARKLAEKLKKPFSAGSDAHFLKMVGNAGIICNSDPLEELRKGKVKLFGRYTPFADMIELIIRKYARSIKDRILGTKFKHI